MNQFKRALAILLAALMLLPALAACGETTEPDDTTAPSQTTSAEEGEDTIPADELPANLNYKGEKITFIRVIAMDYYELTGDAVEDAVSSS